jgi:ParB-like chromosome segregation protein Spo0J
VAGVFIAGHTRLLAARKMGEKKVPVRVAADLTPGQVKAYRLMDNRSHEEAEWDLELLGSELFELKGLDIDLGSTGFDASEISKLLGTNPPASEPEFTPGLALMIEDISEAQQ